jgi:hypothetical protein
MEDEDLKIESELLALKISDLMPTAEPDKEREEPATDTEPLDSTEIEPPEPATPAPLWIDREPPTDPDPLEIDTEPPV